MSWREMGPEAVHRPPLAAGRAQTEGGTGAEGPARRRM